MKNAAVLTFALLLNAGLCSAQAVAAGDAEAGGKLFKRICGGCHQVGASARGSLVRSSTGFSVAPQVARRTTCTPTR